MCLTSRRLACIRWMLRCFEVLRSLIERGATVIVIEHDLDVIHEADYIIDMGPGGGEEGGRIVAAGDLETIRRAPQSQTGRFL